MSLQASGYAEMSNKLTTEPKIVGFYSLVTAFLKVISKNTIMCITCEKALCSYCHCSDTELQVFVAAPCDQAVLCTAL